MIISENKMKVCNYKKINKMNKNISNMKIFKRNTLKIKKKKI